MAISGNAQTHTVTITHGKPVTAGTHGSHVASIAVSGTDRIKLIDVQVGKISFSASNDPAVWRRALAWAVEQGARVVNVSVFCHWEDVEIHALVRNHSGVLFLATSGNQSLQFPEDEAFWRQNGLEPRQHHAHRRLCERRDHPPPGGRGEAIDIFGPSVNIPGYTSLRTLARKRKEDINVMHASDIEKANADGLAMHNAAT